MPQIPVLPLPGINPLPHRPGALVRISEAEEEEDGKKIAKIILNMYAIKACIYSMSES